VILNFRLFFTPLLSQQKFSELSKTHHRGKVIALSHQESSLAQNDETSEKMKGTGKSF
jgi:hypothetical protein